MRTIDFILLIPAIIPFLALPIISLYERCKENMTEVYADMKKICEIPDVIDRLECVSLDSKDVGIISHKPEQPIYRNADCEWKPVFTERKEHRTNCRNCAAPLPSNGKCMYCGTENDREVSEEQSNVRSSMNITSEGITVTCSDIHGEPFKQEIAIRDEKGRLHRREVVDLI